MIGSRSKYDLLASRPAGDFSNLVNYVKALAGAGIELVFLAPGTKDQPIDLRTPAMRKADDEAAQEAAKASGDPRWAEKTTKAGIHIATSDVKRLTHYAKKAEERFPGQHPNLAMSVRNMLLIDTDNKAGVDAFIEAYEQATGERITPTVLTPGKIDPRTGEWVHRDGGHFYFELPDGWKMPDGARSFELADGQISAFVSDRYVLIPPSVRAEGPYRWVGEVREAPAGLLQLIEEQAERVRESERRRAERAAAQAQFGTSSIDTWGSTQRWDSHLVPDGWAPTGDRRQCGCPNWTAPGVHSSPVSATAHDPGCTLFDTSMGHGPLHIWTDNPPAGIQNYRSRTGCKTMTFLQYVAWTKFNGDEAAAIQSLGITGGTSFDPSGVTAAVQAAMDDTNNGSWLDNVVRLRAPVTAESTPEPVSAPVPAVTEAPKKKVERELPEKFVKHGFDPFDEEKFPKGYPADEDLMRKVFDYNDITRAIFHHARDRKPRKAQPYVTLLRELMRRNLRTHQTIGPGGMPLSTYGIVVGRSGTGKSMSSNDDLGLDDKLSPWPELPAPTWLATRAAVTIQPKDPGKGGAIPNGNTSPRLIPHNFDGTTDFASAESVAAIFTTKRTEGDYTWTEMVPHPSAWIVEGEMGDFLATANRGGSNQGKNTVQRPGALVFVLCKTWAREKIGKRSKTHGDECTTGPYTLNLLCGLQAKLAQPVMEMESSGFLQRFLWLPADDAYATCNRPDIPRPAGKVDAPLPNFAEGDSITLCDEAKADVDEALEESYFPHLKDEDRELESHSMQVRVRLAALAALLFGQMEVTPELWEWSGHLMEVSRRTFAWTKVTAEAAANVKAADVGSKNAITKGAEIVTATSETEITIQRITEILIKAGGRQYKSRVLDSLGKTRKAAWGEAALSKMIVAGSVTREGAYIQLNQNQKAGNVA